MRRSDDSESPFADGAHYVGYIGVAQGQPAFPDMQGLHDVNPSEEVVEHFHV